MAAEIAETSMNVALGNLGGIAALSLAAVGSALGTGAAGCAAVGAWKKCYAQGKAAPFMLLTFVGAPLSQTIYGIVLMFIMKGKVSDGMPWQGLVFPGIVAGIGMGMSAWLQGKAGAGGSDALASTGEGFTNYLAALGIIETVAIFVMVFTMLGLG
jgi:V/A-type H+-transporting ATPase subunit K